jgi:ribosomal protein S18 acetylase RimI-like enzyme
LTDKHTRGKVRDFQLTMEDSARVAECFNTFDDSDSWPGGFNEGRILTAERVFDARKKNKDLRVIVAYKDDKVVGYCNVCDSDQDDEGAYVGLLGVDPQYQGQGFGKALLIEAAETAAKAGKRRIDLHTWAGNLKALPLYKRTGYNWVPATRVLMESHIPGILGNKLFQPFFEKYDWYDSFKREILQETDDIKEDNIGVFKYHFEGEGDDSLDVTIDREAKGICAFRMTFENQTLSARVQPKNHVGYIGFRESPVELKIENGSDDDLSYSIELDPSKYFSARLNEDSSGLIKAGGSINISGVYSIATGARSIDRETNADEKVPTQVEWKFRLGNQEISLYSGLIPTTPIIVRAGPFHPCFRPGGSEHVGLGVLNNTSMDLKGEILLKPPKDVVVDSQKIEFNLAPEEAMEESIVISLENGVGDLLSIGLEIYLEDEGTQSCVQRKDFNIPVLGVTGAVAYRGLDNRIVLETENIRGVMLTSPTMGFTRFEHKRMSRIVGGWRVMGLEAGYPFPSEGGEWGRLKPDIQLESRGDYAEVRMTADSIERPGLRYHVTYRIQSGIDLIHVIVRYENMGESDLNDLGIRLTGWFGGIFDHAIIPLRGKLYDLGSVEWSGYPQIPKSANDFHETWCASYRHHERFLLGYIWDPEHVEEIRLRRGMNVPRIEYRLPTLAPGESLEKTALRLYLGDGDWRKVRSLYRKLYGVIEPVTEVYDIRSDLEVEISPKSSKQLRKVPNPIIVDRSKTNNHELRLRITFEDTVDSTIHLKMPDGLLANGEKELRIQVKEIGIDKPFSYPLRITTTNDRSWFRKNGEILIQLKSRNFRTPLTAVVYESALKVERTKTKEGEATLHSLSTGGYAIAACPEHSGTLVRFHKLGEPSVFYDTFPKVGPFIWWEKVFSGLSPIIADLDVWDWESALHKESWTISNEKVGPWVGYKTTSILQHSPGLKGVTVSFRYLILPGTPLMSVEFTTLNSSSQWKRPVVGYRGIPTPGGEGLNTIHTTRDSKRIVHEPTLQESELFAGIEGWGAYESTSNGTVLGIITAYKWDNLLYLDTLGEKAQNFGIRERRALKPGESTSMNSYIVIAQNVDTVELLKDLPEVIE